MNLALLLPRPLLIFAALRRGGEEQQITHDLSKSLTIYVCKGLGLGFARISVRRRNHDASVRLLALAIGRDLRIFGKRLMYHPALERGKRVQNRLFTTLHDLIGDRVGQLR